MIFQPVLTQAANPAFIRFSAENGLPSNTIYDLYQSKNGELIIAHEKGLTRYNGIAFSDFGYSGGNTLTSNIVEFLPGQFIVRNFYGESFYTAGDSLYNETYFTRLEHGFPSYFPFHENQVINITGHTVKLMYENGRIRNEILFETTENIKYGFPCGDLIYLLFNNKVVVLNPVLSSKKEISGAEFNDGRTLFRKGQKVFYVNQDKKDIYGIGADNKMEKEIHLQQIPESTKINFIKCIDDGVCIVGTFNGIYVYDERFRFIGHYLPKIQISCLLQDIEKNIWIGSLQDGVFMIPDLFILQEFPKDDNGEALKIKTIHKVNEYSFLAGTYNGKIIWYNVNGEKIREYDLHRDAEIQSLYYDTTLKQIITYCQELLFIDSIKGRIQDKVVMSPVKSMIYEHGIIYAGTSRGLWIVSHDTEIKSYGSDTVWIRNLVKKNHELFLETGKGLKYFNLNKKQYVNSDRLEYPGIRHLAKYGERIFFAEDATVYFAENNEIHVFKKLPVDHIELFYVTEDDNVLVYDGKKILITRGEEYYFLDETKGLLLHDLIYLEKFDDIVVVAGTNGIQFFHHLKPVNKVIPEVKLKKTAGTFRQINGELVSDYNENFLSLVVEVTPNLASNGSNKLYYKIEGLNDDWQLLIRDHYYLLEQERIPWGKYKLLIYAENEDGFSSQILSVPLRIQTPFYVKWWVISIEIIAFIFVIIILICWRILILKRKNMNKLEREKLKIKVLNAELLALRSQMNPHFIFNSLGSIQAKILQEDHISAYENLSTFSKLLRQSLQFTRLEYITLTDELAFLRNYIQLELLRTDNGFEVQYEIDPAVEPDKILFPSLLSQPFVENAIRHGLMHSRKNKLLKLSVIKQDEMIIFSVEDNGIGRSKSAEINAEMRPDHISYASKAILERVEIINRDGKLIVAITTDDLKQGTRVSIKIKSVK